MRTEARLFMISPCPQLSKCNKNGNYMTCILYRSLFCNILHNMKCECIINEYKLYMSTRHVSVQMYPVPNLPSSSSSTLGPGWPNLCTLHAVHRLPGIQPHFGHERLRLEILKPQKCHVRILVGGFNPVEKY